jgi:hypothetical protein
VARPEEAPPIDGCIYARPDDPSDRPDFTWRQRLVAYNNERENPFDFLEAHCLYSPRTYRQLTSRWGAANIFILSAGWGLVRGDFRLPHYDITFSTAAERYKRRTMRDTYDDLQQLNDDDVRPILFLGCNDYLPLLEKLTGSFSGEKVLFYRSENPPKVSGWRTLHFQTKRLTNWHYGCADELLGGTLHF